MIYFRIWTTKKRFLSKEKKMNSTEPELKRRCDEQLRDAADSKLVFVGRELANTLERIAKDEDPVYKYGLLIELLRTGFAIGLATSSSSLDGQLDRARQLAEDFRAAELPVPPRLQARIEELTESIETFKRSHSLQLKFLDDLALYVRSPRYDPDQPLGHAMMQKAASDFVHVAPPDPLTSLATILIGKQQPTPQQKEQHLRQLVDAATAEAERIYAQVLREQSIKVCGNPYWFEAETRAGQQ